MTVQCSGQTQKGERCKRRIILRGEEKKTGIGYCPTHRPQAVLGPAAAAAAADSAVSGGKGKRKLNVVAPITTFDCQCCYNACDVKEKTKCTNNHEFCRDCLRRWIEEKTVSSGSTRLVCMSTSEECKGEFVPATIESVLSKQALTTWNCRVVQDQLSSAALPDLYVCPKCKFYAAVVEKEEYKNLGNLFECGSAECKYKSCLLCQQPYHHYTISCADALTERKKDPTVRKVVEEVLSNSRIRHCPCGMEFIRIEGCNKCHCSRCQRISCYVCQKQLLDDYTHFTNTPIDWPSFIVEVGKCPLYTSEKYVEEQGVRIAINTVLDKYRSGPSKDLLEAKNLLLRLNPEQSIRINLTFQPVIDLVVGKERRELEDRQAARSSSHSSRPPPVSEKHKKESFWSAWFS